MRGWPRREGEGQDERQNRASASGQRRGRERDETHSSVDVCRRVDVGRVGREERDDRDELLKEAVSAPV